MPFKLPFSSGGTSEQSNIINVFTVRRDDEITWAAFKVLMGGQEADIPIPSQLPQSEKSYLFQSVLSSPVWDLEKVATRLLFNIEEQASTYANTAVVYFIDINRDPPPSSSMLKGSLKLFKALKSKCNPANIFWVTVGWGDENGVPTNQKVLEFQWRNEILWKCLQHGSHFQRLLGADAHDSFQMQMMRLIETPKQKRFDWSLGLGSKPSEAELLEEGEVEIDDLTATDVLIAVMGPTGAGKSTFIKEVSGHQVTIGHDLDSCTEKISIIRFRAPQVTEYRICMVDTPGFDDTNKSDLEIFDAVAKWLDKTFKKKIHLDALLYLHRITDNRMGGTPLKNYKIFEDICGKRGFKQVTLVTTMWDEDPESMEGVYEEREQQLKTLFWGGMVTRGSKTYRWSSGRESAFRIVAEVVSDAVEGKNRQPLKLQTELNDLCLALPATSAGRSMYSKLRDLLKKQQEVLNGLKAGSVVAVEVTDTFKETEQEMKRIVADMQVMELSIPTKLIAILRSRYTFLTS